MFALILALSGVLLLTGEAEAAGCLRSEEASAVIARRLDNEWPLRGSADSVSVYVRRLAERLLDGAEAPGRKRWRFDVVRNLSANAFAVGDGYIIVTDGLVAYVGDESQLAAVLAHEIGHILEGHFCQPRGTTGQEFRVGTLVQHYDPLAEEEADAVAVALLRRAGFDPGAMASVLRCLAASSPSFRTQLNRRIEALERRGLGATGTRPPPDSLNFREARQAVKQDFRGLDSDSRGTNEARPCGR